MTNQAAHDAGACGLDVAVEWSPSPSDWAELDAWLGSESAHVEVVSALVARTASAYDALTVADLDLPALAGSAEPGLLLKLSRRIDEMAAMLAARQAEVLALVAGSAPSGDYLAEVHVETEVALARTLSPMAAGYEIETARALATTFPQFRDALARGEVSMGHCRRLVEATRPVTDVEALARIGEAALPKARGRTVSLFGRHLRLLIARHDPDAASRRKEAVRIQRDVTAQKLDDGLGRLVYVDEWAKVEAVARAVRTVGRATQVSRKRAAAEQRARAHGAAPGQGSRRSRRKAARKLAAQEARDRWDNAGLGEATTASGCRADALLALVLGTEQTDGSVVLDPDRLVRIECQVVIDLATLRGQADRVALLDGQPVPADVGRDWASRAHIYRRMVTDPVTGHLLDKGRAYMADDVRDFVLARDGGCRIPVCGITRHDRLQADHADPHPHGSTSSANLGALSTTHHQLKTHGYLDITDSRADGSATLTTVWGQTIVIPPRSYLDQPETGGWERPAPQPDDDIPPF